MEIKISGLIFGMVRSMLWVCLVLFLAGCKDSSSLEKASPQTKTSQIGSEKTTVWPNAAYQVGGIPVYEEFAQLEPIFRFANDTTYVVNFWATWCKPCLGELPYFEELNSQRKNKKVKVILVSLDFPKQVESNLVPFIQKKQLRSKVVVLLDGKYNDWIDKVSPDWSGAIPATYIYKKGQNRLVGEPFENLEELNEVVEPFL